MIGADYRAVGRDDLDPKAGTAKVYGEGTEGIRYIAVGDVAEVAVRALTVPAARNATIPSGDRTGSARAAPGPS